MLPLHPTILIGCGSYGRSALRRTLQLAHDRGALVWEDVADQGHSVVRRIKQLALVVTPAGPGEDTSAEGDLARDLYNNLEELPAGRPDLFAQMVLRQKERLLDAGRRSTDAARLRLGLDVFVLAQPAAIDLLGNMEALLQPVMDLLANDRSLQPPAPGADLLNFTLILDFDRYWDQSPAGRALRREVQAFAKRCMDRQREGRPSFSRIYLCDGQTGDGRRGESLRIEETAMFLGLLLFEGQRQNVSLRSLFQREHDDSPALAAFGVRCMERSKTLLTRLAAAKFASGWLQSLAGSSATAEAVGSLTSRLDDYLPERIDFAADRADLDAALEAGLDEIERQLVGWTLQTAGEERWSAGVREIAERAVLRIQSELSAVGSECAQRAAERLFGGMSKRLEQLVSEAMGDPGNPLPLGAAIHALQDVERRLLAGISQPAPWEVPEGDPYAGVDEVHRRFREMLDGHVDVADLKQAWPLLAVMAAAAWTPIALSAADELTPVDPTTTFAWRLLHQAVVALDKPWIVAPVLFAAAWIAGARWFHRQITARIERARMFYLHPDQGRLIECLRRLTRFGATGASLRAYRDRVYQEMLDRLRADALRAIGQILERLRERQVEAGWLRGQMREFLRTHGVDPDSDALSVDSDRALSAGYRISIEAEPSLRRILTKNPATRERFKSMQSESKILERWSDRYCDAFLYPVVFLEHLSEYYRELPAQQVAPAEDQLAARSREIIGAVEGFGQFPLAFDWGATTGAAVTTENYCLLPAAWRALPGVMSAIAGQAFPEHRIISGADPDVAYLLRVQLGVLPARLVEGEARAPIPVPEAASG